MNKNEIKIQREEIDCIIINEKDDALWINFEDGTSIFAYIKRRRNDEWVRKTGIVST